MQIIVYILTLPMRIYVTTWTYFLIWRKKRIPKWLQERTKEEINWQPTGKPERYNR